MRWQHKLHGPSDMLLTVYTAMLGAPRKRRSRNVDFHVKPSKMFFFLMMRLL